jgi:hypothetical protein
MLNNAHKKIHDKYKGLNETYIQKNMKVHPKWKTTKNSIHHISKSQTKDLIAA